MKSLERLLSMNKQIRVMGIDDAPFNKARGSLVNFSGIVCTDTRMEGMVWGGATKDGVDATDAIIKVVKQSKFYPQLHLILLDGIAIGGFNVVDLSKLHRTLNLPCVAVMRKAPDMRAIKTALEVFDDGEIRWEIIQKAGEVFYCDGSYSAHSQSCLPQFHFQVQGAEPDTVGRGLAKLTCNGQVPEALRLAHLIGAAVKTGESGNSA